MSGTHLVGARPMAKHARQETGDIFKQATSRASVQIAAEIYTMDETSVAVLRAELDLTKERLAEVRTTLHKKHGITQESITKLTEQLSKVELRLALLAGDPDDQSDQGRIGSHSDQLKKLWAKLDEEKAERAEADKLATNERWKLRLAMVGYGGGTATGVVGIMKLLGFG